MKERPILFSGPMVPPLLAGNKTMTRRIIRNQGIVDKFENQERVPFEALDCKYGRNPGDRLWVRESLIKSKPDAEGEEYVLYEADRSPAILCYDPQGVENIYGWPERWSNRKKISPRFMPKKYSRLTLEITGIWIERLQYISEEDARAEGVVPNRFENGFGQLYPSGGKTPYRRAFAMLWDDLNAKRGYGWEVNPWVWVIAFKRIKP